jgi:REP element-mobilizing transposase RayT
MVHRPGYKALRKGRTSIPNQIYHLTTTTLNRHPFFKDFDTARILIKIIHAQPVNTLAYVVMPDHFHWLIELTDESPSISKLMKNIKLTTVLCSQKAVKKVRWQAGFYDRAIRSHEEITNVARYIVANPIRAGICKSIREYPHWDAIWV